MSVKNYFNARLAVRAKLVSMYSLIPSFKDVAATLNLRYSFCQVTSPQ